MVGQHHQHHRPAALPKRIILVRHGESQGNCDGAAYVSTPDHKIPLTPLGLSQARNAGHLIRHVIATSSALPWKVYFYVSPYERTRSTLREIGKVFPRERILGVREECRIREQDFGNFQEEKRMKAIKETRERFGRFFYRFPEGESAADVYDRVSKDVVYIAGDWEEIGKAFRRGRILGVREECRIREQDFGNFQEEERMKAIKETRNRFGRFFYRFPEGESAADVYDRVSRFLESLWRDIDMNRLHHDPSHDLNLVIISHGLASRVFLMKWFKWTVEQFECLNNFSNCEFRVLQLGLGGEYSLAIHHNEAELQEWGLSPDMIADQKWRAQASKGAWNESCSWYLDEFFDKVADSEDNDEDDKEMGFFDCA